MSSGMRNLVILTVVVAVGTLTIWLLSQRGIIGISTTGQEDDVAIEDFAGLPYLAHVEDDPHPEKKGVTLHNKDLSYAGFNLLTSRLMGGSHLLDMEGNILHSWHTNDRIGSDWIYSEMDEAGNVTALVHGPGLVRMDWNSGVIWISSPSENPHLSKEGTAGYHHDFEVAESGDIYVLAVELLQADLPSGELLIRDNGIVVLDSGGVPKGKISLYRLLRDLLSEEPIATKLKRLKTGKLPRLRKLQIRTKGLDLFHANTVEEIPRDIGVARRGDLLFCVRNLDLIGIVDVEEEELIWHWGPGTLQRPHHPTVLENGNILVFDNGTPQRGYSRVLEVDPGAKQIVWEFRASPPESFYSKGRGGNQRLPNGNTLITESERGHVFEVTDSGEIVWDFWNFESNEDGQRGIIYRMMRYDPGFLKR